MRWIPPGLYSMGNPNSGLGRRVRTDGFWIGETEVSGAQWKVVLTWGLAHGYTNVSEGHAAEPNFAVTNVEWIDCIAWCNARSEMENLTPCYYCDKEWQQTYRGFPSSGPAPPLIHLRDSADGYRLPSSAEWEKAARGGLREKHYPWGLSSEILSEIEIAKHAAAGNLDEQLPIASHPPNRFGLFDMAGGVWEWCWDSGGENEEFDNTRNRRKKSSTLTSDSGCVRGGSWKSRPTQCTVYSSVSCGQFQRFSDVGFRVARSQLTAKPRKFGTEF